MELFTQKHIYYIAIIASNIIQIQIQMQISVFQYRGLHDPD